MAKKPRQSLPMALPKRLSLIRAGTHMGACPLSRGKPNCIKAQLDEYYKEKCPNAQLKTIDKNRKQIKPSDGNQTV